MTWDNDQWDDDVDDNDDDEEDPWEDPDPRRPNRNPMYDYDDGEWDEDMDDDYDDDDEWEITEYDSLDDVDLSDFIGDDPFLDAGEELEITASLYED